MFLYPLTQRRLQSR